MTRPRPQVLPLPCKHFFHTGCVTRWLGMRRTCPKCRHPVVPLEEGDDDQREVLNPPLSFPSPPHTISTFAHTSLPLLLLLLICLIPRHRARLCLPSHALRPPGHKHTPCFHFPLLSSPARSPLTPPPPILTPSPLPPSRASSSAAPPPSSGYRSSAGSPRRARQSVPAPPASRLPLPLPAYPLSASLSTTADASTSQHPRVLHEASCPLFSPPPPRLYPRPSTLGEASLEKTLPKCEPPPASPTLCLTSCLCSAGRGPHRGRQQHGDCDDYDHAQHLAPRLPACSCPRTTPRIPPLPEQPAGWGYGGGEGHGGAAAAAPAREVLSSQRLRGVLAVCLP